MPAPYIAACFCGSVVYEVNAEPVDSKICHCRVCQKLHGAPMQWAVIFHKKDIHFTSGEELLRFYSSERRTAERVLPCKVSCSLCGTLIADEGRRMWLAFPSLFDFGGSAPVNFRPTCHIFYGDRLMDVNDDLPKYEGHKGRSALI